MNSRLKAFYDGCQVRRCHTLRTLRQDTIGEHSCRVAWLALELGKRAKLLDNELLRIVEAALLHDTAEFYTGDMSAPAKKKVSEALHRLEDEYMLSAGLDVPALTPLETLILKVADTADLLIQSEEEILLGNQNFHPVQAKCAEWLSQMLEGHPKVKFDLINLIGEFTDGR